DAKRCLTVATFRSRAVGVNPLGAVAPQECQRIAGVRLPPVGVSRSRSGGGAPRRGATPFFAGVLAFACLTFPREGKSAKCALVAWRFAERVRRRWGSVFGWRRFECLKSRPGEWDKETETASGRETAGRCVFWVRKDDEP